MDVAQLRRRDPAAWTALLHHEPELQNEVVTAVSARPIQSPTGHSRKNRVVRYILALEGCSDPVTFIGKHTNEIETRFFRQIADQIPQLAPHCWYTHLSNDHGWIVCEDVPAHFPPEKWTILEVEEVVAQLTRLHATYWQKEKLLRQEGFEHFIGERTYNWEELHELEAIYFQEGPAAIISEHAIYNTHDLAPTFLRAANGLAVIQSLGGWPGILGESHMTALFDLLDDPVPMLERLRELPVTLLHGNPHSYHWRLTLFDDLRLVDWHHAVMGPGVCDLVHFLEQFELLYDDTSHWGLQVRQEWPATEETIVDSYLLGMSSKLGQRFNSRTVRQAVPAARCLYVLTHWLPQFADWFGDMPNKYTWQRVNRMSDDQLRGSIFEPMVGLRPYLANVFQRFLKAYRTL